jgi:agmatine deiminase
MPAEWEPHAATWLGWPHQRTDWPGKFAPIPWVYGEIVRTLSRYEAVNVIVPDERTNAQAERLLRRVRANSRSVRFRKISTNRSWVRDSGPIFVTNSEGEKTALDWQFNAWAKYPDWQIDDQLPAAIALELGVPAVRPTFDGRRVVLEGGSIEGNGRGLLLTTEECLLGDVQQRNPGLTRAGYELVFAEYLGVSKVLWLGRGIVGDDTHGHIDDLARFVNPTTVVAVFESNSSDDNQELLQENFDRLSGMTDLDGRKLEVVKLPMPAALFHRGQRLPASYANFYIANGVVIVPTFNDPNDRIALGTLAELFPGREVIGIHCVDLVWGLGTLHCMTQQEPL